MQNLEGSSMNETRLTEINKRFEALGLTPEWINQYMENRALYPMHPEKAMTPDGRMIMLPPGTLPDYVFFGTLSKIIKEMEIAKQNAIQAQSPMQPADSGSTANLDEYQRHLCRFYVIQNDLHIHLTQYKPISTGEFLEEVNSLINERLRLLSIHYTDEGAAFAARQGCRGILPNDYFT